MMGVKNLYGRPVPVDEPIFFPSYFRSTNIKNQHGEHFLKLTFTIDGQPVSLGLSAGAARQVIESMEKILPFVEGKVEVSH